MLPFEIVVLHVEISFRSSACVIETDSFLFTLFPIVRQNGPIIHIVSQTSLLYLPWVWPQCVGQPDESLILHELLDPERCYLGLLVVYLHIPPPSYASNSDCQNWQLSTLIECRGCPKTTRTAWCTAMVLLRVLQWYRLLRYDGTVSPILSPS